MSKITGFIGTYTKGESEGIYSFTLDTDKAKMMDIKLAAKAENPTYVTVSKSAPELYAVVKSGAQGGLAAYSIKENGGLSLASIQLTDGTSPCHVSIDSKNTFAAAAYYHRGTVELYTSEEGNLKPLLHSVQHEGNGPNEERQEKPHVHYSGFSPDERFLFAVDLGTDHIITYAFDEGRLIEKTRLSVRPGSGPRHLVFHPNGCRAYVMTELSNEVISLDYDAETGCFTERQYISALPADFHGHSQGSAIHLSSDGRFVYAGNRGHDSIAVFAAEEDGSLVLVEHVPTGGSWPRDFSLDPSERFLVAANQESHNLVLFARDAESGKLNRLSSEVSVPYPVCIKFMS